MPTSPTPIRDSPTRSRRCLDLGADARSPPDASPQQARGEKFCVDASSFMRRVWRRRRGAQRLGPGLGWPWRGAVGGPGTAIPGGEAPALRLPLPFRDPGASKTRITKPERLGKYCPRMRQSRISDRRHPDGSPPLRRGSRRGPSGRRRSRCTADTSVNSCPISGASLSGGAGLVGLRRDLASGCAYRLLLSQMALGADRLSAAVPCRAAQCPESPVFADEQSA